MAFLREKKKKKQKKTKERRRLSSVGKDVFILVSRVPGVPGVSSNTEPACRLATGRRDA